MNKLRIFIALLFAAGLICVGSTVAYASTSDALFEQSLVRNSIEQCGSSYEAPYVSSGDNVSLYDGNVNISEVDMSLPGKNGMDVNIIRTHYVNGAPGAYFGDDMRSSSVKILTSYVYPYTYTQNGVSKTAYVEFDCEEDIVDTFQTTATLLEKKIDRDDRGVIFYNYGVINSSGITMTRVKNQAPVALHYSLDELYRLRSTGDISIGYGWYITMPKVVKVNQTETSSGNTQRNTCTFTKDDGETLDFKFTRSYYEDEGWKLDTDNCTISEAGSPYSVEIFETLQAHSAGFSYDMKITDGGGKTYYFLFFNNNKEKLPVAITDRYGNVIRYTQNSDGSVTITDTFERLITVSSSGITVTKDNNSKSVQYILSRTNDPDRDPDGLLNCYSKYSFKVRKYNGSSYETTEYISHKSTIKFNNWQRKYYDKIEKIISPSNAVLEYTYEETPTVEKHASSMGLNHVSHRDYHITGSKAYEDGAEKLTKTYSFIQASPNGAFVTNRGKQVTVKESYDDGTKKDTYYDYDHLGRLYEEYFYQDRVKHSKQYIYSKSSFDYYNELSATTLLNMRKAYVKGTMSRYGSNIIDVSYNELNGRRQPTRTAEGERETLCTYDDNYGLLLSKTYPKDGGTTIKVENTMTADGKGIRTSRTYENGVSKFYDYYTYNSDGTVASVTRYPSSGTAVKTDYTYTYNADGSYTVSEKMNGVQNADGANVNVTTTKAYDWLGNLVSATDGNGYTTSYQYDALGRVKKQINPDGTSKNISYNVSQNSVTVTDENGNVTTSDYTPLGNLDKIYYDNNSNHVTAKVTYDNQNRMISESLYSEDGAPPTSENYTYDILGRVTSKTTKYNTTTLDTVSYAYEYGDGWITKGTSAFIDVPEGTTKIEVAYYSMTMGGMVKVLKNNKVECLKIGASYRSMAFGSADITGEEQITITQDGGTVYYRFLTGEDKENNISLLGGGASQTVTATYTGDSYYVKPTVKSLTDGFGNVVSQTYLKHGASTILDKKTYKYDLAGNVLETKGGRTYTENLGDYTTKAEYDFQGNPIKTYRADGSSQTNTYDSYGNLLSSTDYLGNTTTYTYDRLNRQIKVTAPFDDSQSSKTMTYYDNNGNVVKTKELVNVTNSAEEYRTTEYEYDSRNRLVTVKVNDGSRDIYTQYAYDNADNPVKVVTGQTSKLSNLYGAIPDEATYTNYEYDRFGNVTKETDALGNSEYTYYDWLSRPTENIDKNGNGTLYSFNAYGSMTSCIKEDETVTNTYSKNNLLVKSQKGNDVITYTYDDFGNVKTENNNGVINTYTYDADGNRKTFNQKEGNTTYINASYTYDNLNRVTKISHSNGISANYTYDANDRVIEEVNNNVENKYTYNKGGTLFNITTTSTLNDVFEGTAIYHVYSYNLLGEITKKIKASMDFDTFDTLRAESTYTYDGIGQMKKELNGDYYGYDRWFAYTYDTRGNRTGMLDDDDYYYTSYTYDKNNRLLSTSGSSDYSAVTTVTYTYDNNGNRLSKNTDMRRKTDNSQTYYDTHTYTYDASNRLTGYQYYKMNIWSGYEDELTATYTYDPLGKRKTFFSDETTTNFYWDGDNIVREKGPGTTTYYRGKDSIIAQIKDGTKNYYVYDGHGDTIALLDSNGFLTVEEKTYTTFGNAMEKSLYVPFRYNGQYYDSYSGLYYLRNRYYDPELGRFLTEDPYWNANNMIHGDKQYGEGEAKIPDYSAIAQSLNLYVYCMNDPVNRADPSGLISWQEASNIIRENAWAIKNAGAYYGVNPAILAGCIYTELTWNYNWVDELTDLPLYFLDTSIGIAQVKVSTAIMLEDSGYIAKTEFSYIVENLWYAPGVGYVEANNRNQAVATRLTSPSESINYAAAYLSYIQDLWRDAYPQIDGKSDILGTLYNIGEYGSRGINSNPESRPFGDNVKNEYNYMRELLGI